MEAQLDLHRLQALNQEWSRMPPVEDLVAAIVGYEPPERAAAPDSSGTPEASFEAFEQLFSAAGGGVS